MTKKRIDAVVSNHGSIYTVALESKRAKSWWAYHVDNSLVDFGGQKCVEHRYIADIVDGMVNDGMNVI